MKLWIMNVDTKSKAMLKFGSLETLCVDGRPIKQFKLSHNLSIHVMPGIMYTFPCN